MSGSDRQRVPVPENAGAVPLGAPVKPGLAQTLAIGIAAAAKLAELHRSGIVHGDIHPGAILFDARTQGVQLAGAPVASREPAALARRKLPVRLAYCSPEQTGRMNRALDYRTDFYSLGTVLYELATGVAPFQSEDPLELIHWHIARMPRVPSELDPAIPAPFSQIVMKLLAKTAEDRYQSAVGLRFDLEQCAAQWDARRDIAPFALGTRDRSERFTISERLYGRDCEAATLLAAFDRSARGRPGLMLVAGYAGVGKTALIHELCKPIARERGYFIAGKFDQLSRDIPYGALCRAFEQLVQQLLAERPRRLAELRERLRAALGDNAGVIAEVIPDIELVIGKQAPPVAVAPAEAQNRFNRVFGRFVAVLARPEHPLAVFLDDLQWADSATLNLLEPLLLGADIESLFLIGAYRDNEVAPGHALLDTVRRLERAGAQVDSITLAPLGLADLAQMVDDTLRSEPERTRSLAEVLLAKTDGNPFFVIQFLKTLHQDRLVVFDAGESRWNWHIDAIRNAGITDNVVDLMSRKIERLALTTQRVLTLAACIGNRFDLETLATVCEQTPDAVLRDLAEAAAEGLIAPAGAESFAFLHDRVQQAAYARIPDARKPLVHLTAGRLLLAKWPRDRPGEGVFEIASHLNLGARLIDSAAEHLVLARLNLAAGHKAKQSAAYQAARGYFAAGIGLLEESRWESDYDLRFALGREAAQCEYLCGHFDAAERQIAELLARAATSLDKASVYSLRMVQQENLSRYADALASAREGLVLFGVSFPDAEEEKRVMLEAEIGAIESALGARTIASLVDLPAMTDPEIRMVMSILTDIWSSAYILGDATLARLMSAKMVHLSLVHGNTGESAYGYVTHAITVGPVRGDYASAYEFGLLALQVNERLGDSRRRAKIHQQFHAHVNLWRRPMQTCVPHAREATRSGLETGDFLYAAYGASTESWPAIVATQDLAQFGRDLLPNLALVEKLKIASFADSLAMIMSWARALQGTTESPLALSHEGFDERAYVQAYRENPFFTMFHGIARLQLAYLFGEYGQALATARAIRGTAHRLTGMIWTVLFDFWSGLTLAANFAGAAADERAIYLEEMARARQSLAALAESCPENFLCQSLLLAAEIERVTGAQPAALALFERAIAYADEAGMVQHQALANELFARFWLGRGNRRVAALYLRDARDHYARWGAHAKARSLVERYGELAEAPAGERADPGAGLKYETLDVATIVKAAHAITEKIDLAEFLRQMLMIAIENAGARRGLLIEDRAGELRIAAEGAVDPDRFELVRDVALSADAERCSGAIVNYVARTQSSLVIADATRDERFAADPYVARAAPRSILCMPIIHQGRLSAVLYLENNLAVGAFNDERIEVMRVLLTQAAISLENARLFDGLRREVGERNAAEERLREALTRVEALKNELEAENVYLRRDLIANVSHDLRTPLAALRGYLETLLMKGDSLPGEQRRTYLGIASRESARLAALVDELFELAKLDFRGFELNREPVKLDELAQDVLQRFGLDAERRGVALALRSPHDVPFVQADIGLIERAFANLIENALKHSPDGGAVTFTVLAEDGRVRVSIADNGTGIPREDLPFVFDRFFRGDKSRSTAGAGLGLAITKRIVELHGARIEVDSTAETGTSFAFALPASEGRGVAKPDAT